MSELEDEAPELEPEDAPQESLRSLPRWKVASLALAVVSILVGFGMQVTAGDGGETATTSAPGSASGSASSPELSGSLVPQGTPPITPGGQEGEPQGEASADEAPGGASDWSPFFVKGGFSFFVGFCIGYALRTFFKVSAVALGLVFLLLFGLEYVGFIQVDWASAGELYDQVVARLSGELESLKGFVTGSLPSVGLAGLGLFAGFKRTR